MQLIDAGLDSVRNTVRGFMHSIAKLLNALSGGHLSPNAITITGLLAHLPIAWLIAQQRYIPAAILLIIFGLFDTLDGELARLQKRSSAAGMLLDASTDRFKEVMLYTGAAYSFIGLGRPYMAVWAVIACGASLCVSYVKAKGETAVAKSKLTPNEVNRLFQDGLVRFEVRMFLLVLGLLTGRLVLAVMVIAILSTTTAIGRLIRISKAI